MIHEMGWYRAWSVEVQPPLIGTVVVTISLRGYEFLSGVNLTMMTRPRRRDGRTT